MFKSPIVMAIILIHLNGYAQNPKKMTFKYTNALIHETSPYLLQHAHNPVNWEAWKPEVLERAKKENKLLLISIGYAACHWCHVMEHECFEDEEVAQTMNRNFINIKIDREERPDVDHIYMDAIQMMTGHGGWPLNIVALPDGRPFWGATYVKKEHWIKVLQQLSDLYQTKPEKALDYAQSLADGIKTINLVANKTDTDIISMSKIDGAVKGWSRYFDTYLGGYKRAPKFMMPVNLNFLLHYGTVQKDESILEYVNNTLTRMAWGGIFDHVGGGFSRYSVDIKWHVPHFEKMLYDNGQLISLYSQAYATTQNKRYKRTVEKTIAFVEKELLNGTNGFYSSLDADSLTYEGKLEEGAFYVWKTEQLKSLLKQHYSVFKTYFNINSYGHWEHGNHVLIRDASNDKIAKKLSMDKARLKSVIEECLDILERERDKRNKPRLDDKILTSWNGLMLKGLVDAYRYLGKNSYLDLALKNADFITTHLIKTDGGLFHNHKNGKSTINGYLEDYAAVVDAFIGLYEVTFDEKWLTLSNDLIDYCLVNFFDTDSKLFFFTSKQDDFVIRRTVETTDNVIPASNSVMAKNLFRLAKLYNEKRYGEIAIQMFKNVQENFEKNAQSHANWMQLALFLNQPFYEIAIVGEKFEKKAKEIGKHYLPHTIFAATGVEADLPLLKNRYNANKTLVYICEHGTCKLPLTQTKEVLSQLQF